MTSIQKKILTIVIIIFIFIIIFALVLRYGAHLFADDFDYLKTFT